VLFIGGLGMLALLTGLFLWLRFFELAAPLTLLAIALGTLPMAAGSPARRRASPRPSQAPVWLAAGVILVGALFTFSRLRQYHVGQLAPPRPMAEWLGGQGRPGERVFTANWADSAPLFYYAPQLQSLVVLDPTFFLLADPERFRLYVDIIEGREAEPARAIRERFGARWVTIWKVPGYKTFATRIVRSGEATVAFADPFYLVLDLGETGGGKATGRTAP
jgi:hypothetical protein